MSAATKEAVEVASKICRDCGGTFTLDHFFPSRRGDRVYRGSYCKPCDVERRRAWGKANPERLRALEQSSRRNRREKIRETKRASYLRHREKRIAAQKRWDANNSERRKVIDKAKNIVRRAIQSGRLVRPTVCEECGATNVMTEGAHADYQQPLLVRWLCRPCHRSWDEATPKSIIVPLLISAR
jgi:hypothetical protein